MLANPTERRFTQTLKLHGVPEWSKYYLDFQSLMQIIADFFHLMETRHTQLLKREAVEFEAKLWDSIEAEFKKVHVFFKARVAKAAQLYQDVEMATKNLDPTDNQRAYMRKAHKLLGHKAAAHVLPSTHSKQRFIREIKDLKEAEYQWSEFYVSLMQLRNFVELNYMGFSKILERSDKMLAKTTREQGKEWLKNYRKRLRDEEKEVIRMIQGTEKHMEFLTGSHAEAIKKLKMPPMRERQAPNVTFRIGIYLGIAIIAFFLCIVQLFKHDNILWTKVPPWLPFRLYRGWLACALHVIGFASNIYIWQQNGVNRILIFGIDPRKHLTYQGVMEIGVMLLALWSLSLFCFLTSLHFDVSPVYPVLALNIIPVLWLCNPFPCLKYKARTWFIAQLLSSLFPIRKVTFINFWLMDQLTSHSRSLVDIKYSYCIFATAVNWTNKAELRISADNGTDDKMLSMVHSHDFCSGSLYGLSVLVAALPYICRMVQCVRRGFDDPRMKRVHYLNAVKYLMSAVELTIGAFAGFCYSKRYLEGWMVLSAMLMAAKIAHYFFLLAWDLIFDWGLLYTDKEAYLLRAELVYQRKSYYYLGIVANCVFRFFPLCYMWLGHGYGIQHEIILTFLTLVEVGRRLMWNLFRLENEHINNVGRFRAHRDISVKPFKAIEAPGDKKND